MYKDSVHKGKAEGEEFCVRVPMIGEKKFVYHKQVLGRHNSKREKF